MQISLILLNKNALKEDLNTLVLFLKKFIKKKEESPKNSQEISKRIQLLDKISKTILIIKKFN